jgi:hypothetical protein
VKPRDAARALAIGRVALGLGLVLAPRRAGVAAVGPDADSAGATVVARALGIRDAIFGGMVLHTVDHPQVGKRWLTACAVADGVDAFAALAARRDLPAARGLAFVLIAGGSAVAHVALSQAADSPAGLEDVAASSPPQPASAPETVYPDGSQEAMRSMGARTEGRIPAAE